MNIPKHINDAWNTGLLKPISLFDGEFSLVGTDYIAIVRKDGVYWQTKKVVGSSKVHIQYVTVSFDEVFDNCPKDIREKMIYHLDVFAKRETIGFGQVIINPPGKLSYVEITFELGEKDE
jgi:hypothetical protein